MIILLIILFLTSVVQIIYQTFFIIGNQKITKNENINITKNHLSVSIIICAKNEYENLKLNLPYLKTIDFFGIDYEIILVNDGSEDKSFKLLEEFKANTNNCRIIHLDRNLKKDLPGKKYALREGVRLATKDYVLLTDADCIPKYKSWVIQMLQEILQKKADILLGYSPYLKKSTFLNNFIQFETIHTAIQYMTYSSFNRAYMGVGRNLLYKRNFLLDAFESPILIEQLKKTSSGDDDLIINYYTGKAKIASTMNSETHTLSIPPTNWKQYFKQKTRHTSSAKYYKNTTKFLLGIYALSHFIFWFGIIIMIFIFGLGNKIDNSILIFSIFPLSALVLKLYNYKVWVKSTQQDISIFKLLAFDFFWSIYNVILSPYIFWKNKTKWN